MINTLLDKFNAVWFIIGMLLGSNLGLIVGGLLAGCKKYDRGVVDV